MENRPSIHINKSGFNLPSASIIAVLAICLICSSHLVPLLKEASSPNSHNPVVNPASNAGNYITFITWYVCGIAAALTTGGLALAQYATRKGTPSLIIGGTLLSTALFDLYSISACGMLAGMAQTENIYEYSLISRGLNAFLLALGTAHYIFSHQSKTNKTPTIVITACATSLAAAIALTLFITKVPASIVPGSIPHLQELGVLTLYLATGLIILLQSGHRSPASLLHTIGLTIVPAAFATAFMALHRLEFDAFFNTAYMLRAVAHLAPLLAIAASFTGASSKEQNLVKELHRQIQVDTQTEKALKEQEAATLRTGAELQKNVEELVRSNSELEQFAYVASHDLQEPLRKIQAFGNLLQRDYGNLLPEEGRGYIERMCNASARMQTLIDDLLSMSRTGRNESAFTSVNLEEIIREVITDLEYTIEKKRARVIINANMTIKAIPAQMRQLFQNTISNSLKFARGGTAPVVTVTAKPINKDVLNSRLGYILTEEKYCMIEVADNGIGFEKEDSERIFMLFQRLHTRKEYDGAGLGLALCKKITDNHSGYIEAEGEEGQGALIRILLPI